MPKLAQKCENNVTSKQNYASTVAIALKMVYPCCFSSGGGGNLNFLEFLQKKFYNIDNWSESQL